MKISLNFCQKADFKIPSRIEDYLIFHEIGSGTSARVHLAQKIGSENKICVKIIPKYKIFCSFDEMHVKAEIDILQKYQHKNLIKFVDFIELPDCYCIFQKLFHQDSLLDIINENPSLSEDQIQRIFSQLIEVVAFLHEKGVCHRDIKLENILIGKNLKLKLIDFGSASQNGNCLQKTSRGNPLYSAPECITEKIYDGAAADIWACGVVLYALVCKTLPFSQPNVDNMILKITKWTYQTPTTCSKSCSHLISKLLTVDPKARYTIFDITQHKFMANMFDGNQFKNTQVQNKEIRENNSNRLKSRSYEETPSFKNGKKTTTTKRKNSKSAARTTSMRHTKDFVLNFEVDEFDQRIYPQNFEF